MKKQNLIHYLSAVAGLCALIMGAVSSSVQASWNAPYSNEELQSETLFSSFSSPPKHLDPVVSYSSNEWAILSQIYEPPLQYHYLKRPYALEPLTLKALPEVRYLNKDLTPVAKDSPELAFSEYHFHLRDDVRYQPHPAFAKDEQGGFLYHNLDANEVAHIRSVFDFEQQGTRSLLADDYIYAIKRMGLKQNHSPILPSMNEYIVGLKEYSEAITALYKQSLEQNQIAANKADRYYFDLNQLGIDGVKKHSDTHFSIRVHGTYPQFLYWLTMNFFAPIPWEADKFYRQSALVEKNITLNTAPVGTGAYYLAENNPNKRMRLLLNPNYHQEFYPSDGLPEGEDPALLKDAGKPLPFIEEVVYTLEKESVPLWNKFLQGYYDASGVSSDSFDQAVSVSTAGDLSLTEQMQEKGIQFKSIVQPSIFYMGFNMADEIVGGYTPEKQKLRQAISIALNYEEYISIFMNGRGIAAQGPIPPGIYGFSDDAMNPYVYQQRDGRIQRQSLAVAKTLLAEAGYPEGLLPSGERLTLYYDTPAVGPDSQAQLNWYRKQLSKIGIELVIRASDYNRFQEKVRGAKVQLFTWGWNADYPDPENFLFLLYGANAAINSPGGINGANYDNPEFNRLFEQMKTMENSAQRLQIIEQMIAIAQKDAPWVWGFHPKALVLFHQWQQNLLPNPMANNTLKYRRLDTSLRQELQQQWNPPIVWPLWLALALVLLSIIPIWRALRKRQQQTISG